MANKNSRAIYINGTRLKKLLFARNISQVELAKRVGLGKNTIWRAIKYNRIENKKNIINIAKELDVEPKYLVDDIYDPRCSPIFGENLSLLINNQKEDEVDKKRKKLIRLIKTMNKKDLESLEKIIKTKGC